MTTTIKYDDKSVRAFMIASIFWGIIGMTAGVLIATQLSWWQMNGSFWGLMEKLTGGAFKADGVSYLTFGRLRPLHTNAVIFAFVGNMMFAGIYYSTQRLCKVRTASDLLTRIHFWGWQLIIVAAAVTLPCGLTRGKEYAELIWPINIAVVLIWVVFAVNFFWTLAKRNEPSLYVALWFYMSCILTVAMLYIVNHLSLPTAWNHSYPIFAGLKDGLVQWWYGHNAVAFFLTTPILGIMYYFLPKAAGRPVYSYRLSIIHFWSLVFIYIWAGPHHLLNTALPTWLQYLGMTFSLMLWAPSWGGMLNGLLTLRGAWDKLRTDPVIKFFVAGVTFYGMSTFEGPLMSITKVNALSHYTDWTIGHVHAGALGWNGFMAAGMFYWLAPRLWQTKLWSKALADMHFWVGLVGILLYIVAMWCSGISQGLMLGQFKPDGFSLAYDFVDTLENIKVFFILRSLGGLLFVSGFVMLAFNVWQTARSGSPSEETAEVTVLKKSGKDNMGWFAALVNDPLAYLGLGICTTLLWFFLPPHADKAALVLTILLAIKAVLAFKNSNNSWTDWHERIIENYLPFAVLVFLAAAVGGAVQIIPTLIVNRSKNVEGRLQELYTPLELAGRDIYVQEGCYLCHSQMIRTLKGDVVRYGRPGIVDDYSHLGESIYDHPYQWGSKRTGPDLAHEGGDLVPGAKYMRSGKRGNDWHFNHFYDPRSKSDGSNMPAYPWLFDAGSNKDLIKALPNRIAAQRTLGVPWPPMSNDEIKDKAEAQATEIAKSLVDAGVFLPDQKDLTGDKLRQHLETTKVVALIAFVQKLGTFKTVDKGGPPTSRALNPDSYRKADPPPVAPGAAKPAAPAPAAGTPAPAGTAPAPGTPAAPAA
ncbi:MAG: cytochrome-c oxidase, cbb3-type subunit I, partial [Verrucomicrobia bacterium]|nr:cytochrome-c oxidase, cbb3-type subunit I [Verrucomicrobiota bacterium]